MTDQAEHSRMIRLIIGADRWISTIYRHQILGQIVGSNTGEIHLCRRLVSQYSNGWDLYHDPCFEVRLEGMTLSLQLCLDLLQAAFAI